MNPEVSHGVSAAVGAEEPGLAKGVIKLPGVLFVAIAAIAPGAGAT